MGTTQKSVYPKASVAPTFMGMVMQAMAQQLGGMEFMTKWKPGRKWRGRGYNTQRPRTGPYWDAVNSERWRKLQKMTNWQTCRWIELGGKDKDIDRCLEMKRRTS